MARPELVPRSKLLNALDSPFALLGCLVVLAPLAIGGVHLWTQAGLALIAIGSFVLLNLRLVRQRSRLRVTMVGVGLAVGLFWTLVQWIPLPADLVAVLAPQTFEAQEMSGALTGAGTAGWLPLTRDPSRTALALLTLMGLSLTFLVAANSREHREERRVLGLFIEMAGLAVFLLGCVHAILSPQAILGFYRSSVDLSSQRFLTTFVNPNHAAALMLLASCTAYGLWLSSGEKVRAGLHLVVSGLLACGVAATGSRSGLGLVILSLSLISLIAYIQKEDRDVRRRIVQATFGGLCLGAVGWLLLASSGVDANLWGLDTDWLDRELLGRWAVGVDVARENLILGAGHGAFGTASSLLMTDWSGGHVTYAHNLFLQLVADWGVVVSSLFLIFMIWGISGAIRVIRDRIELLAVAVALVALFVQNQVEFSLLIPGVSYVAIVGLGWIVGDALRAAERDERRSHRWAKPRFRISHVVTVTVAALWLLTSFQAVSQDPDRWRRGIEAAVKVDKPGQISIDQMLSEHPSDFYIHSLAAHLAFHSDRKKEGRAIADRAIELAPHNHSVLKLRAAMDIRSEAPIKALPYLIRLSKEGDVGMRMAVRMVLDARQHKALAESFFSTDIQHSQMAVSLLRQRGAHDAVEQMLIWTRIKFPESLENTEELLDVWRFKAGKEQALKKLSTQLLVKSTSETSPERVKQLRRLAYLAQGYLSKREKRLREAWHLFRTAASLDPKRDLRPLLQAGHTLVALGDTRALRALLKELNGRFDDSAPYLRGQHHHLRSELYEAEGDLRGAVTQMQRAVLYLKGHPAYHQRLAGLYEKMGDTKSATAVRKRLSRQRQAVGE